MLKYSFDPHQTIVIPIFYFYFNFKYLFILNPTVIIFHAPYFTYLIVPLISYLLHFINL